MDSYDSYKALLDEMTPEEKAQYWKRENTKENLSFMNQMYGWIDTDKSIIETTRAWLHRSVAKFKEHLVDEATLKQDLLLGAELIQGSEDSILITRAEIAHYTKYPLYSEKRRQWYKTKEGIQWQQKVMNQLKTR